MNSHTPLDISSGSPASESPQALLHSPKVSLIVTNYNYELYIPACLQSIAAQRYQNFECFVIDDCSSDNSIEVIQGFIKDTKDSRFKLVQRTENGGQMAAFLSGLELASGVFVAFVDADDLLFPDFLASHIQAHLNQHYAVAFSSSDQASIDARGQVLANTCPSLKKDRQGRAELDVPTAWQAHDPAASTVEDTPQHINYLPAHGAYHMGWFWGTTSTMMFRRSVLQLILGAHCSQFRVCADYYLATFSQAIGGSLTLDSCLGAYRRHGKNAYTSANVLGGERSCDNVISHPPYGQFNTAFSQHLLDNFDTFFALLDRDHSHSLLARFAPPKLYRKILLNRGKIKSKFLSRKRLLIYRLVWALLRQERRAAKFFAVLSRYMRNRP